MSKDIIVDNFYNTENFFFLGQETKLGSISTEKNECYNSFLFASLKPGNNIRIDRPTIDDPNIFIDTKYYDFQAYKTPQNNKQSNTLFYDAVSYLENTTTPQNDSFFKGREGDIVYFIKGVKTNSAIIIDADDDSFYFGKDGKIRFKNGNVYSEDAPPVTNAKELILSTHQYRIVNAESSHTNIFSHKEVDDFKNTNFFFKKIVPGNCIKFEDDGQRIRILYDDECKTLPDCVGVTTDQCKLDYPLPCDECSEISRIGIFATTGDEYEILDRNSFDENCTWTKDTYTYSMTSGPFIPSVSGSDIVPWIIKVGDYYKNEFYEDKWIIRILKYEMWYRWEDDVYYEVDDINQCNNKAGWYLFHQKFGLNILSQVSESITDSVSSIPTDTNKTQPVGIYEYDPYMTQDWVEKFDNIYVEEPYIWEPPVFPPPPPWLYSSSSSESTSSSSMSSSSSSIEYQITLSSNDHIYDGEVYILDYLNGDNSYLTAKVYFAWDGC